MALTDDRLLASASEDGKVLLWDLAEDQQAIRLDLVAAAVYAIAFGPDGALLASGSEDGTIRLWDTANGKMKASIQTGEAPTTALAFRTDGHVLARWGGGWRRASVGSARLSAAGKRSGTLPPRGPGLRDAATGLGTPPVGHEDRARVPCRGRTASPGPDRCASGEGHRRPRGQPVWRSFDIAPVLEAAKGCEDKLDQVLRWLDAQDLTPSPRSRQ